MLFNHGNNVTQFFFKRFERMPEFLVRMLPRLWCRAPASHNRVYLTFDDGPHPERTPLILDVLEEFGLCATFFLIGKRAQRHPGLVQRLAARHRLGNHTWNHPNLRWRGPRVFAAELEPTRKLLEDLAGTAVRLFRPPYGAFGPSLTRYARRHDHQIVLWQVLPWDFRPERSAAQIADCLVRHTTAGSIIVLHDGHACAGKTAAALRVALPVLLEHGFTFAPLPNCDLSGAPAASRSSQTAGSFFGISF